MKCYNKGNLGRKFTEEHKRKIGLGNKGKIVSEESKLKNRLVHLGKKASEGAKHKMSLIHKGKQLSEEHKVKLALSKLGNNNPQWKDDNVGYNALHGWVKRHLSKPELCQNCNNSKPYDLANITGVYNREFSNWKYLCRRCHMILDYKVGVRIGKNKKM